MPSHIRILVLVALATTITLTGCASRVPKPTTDATITTQHAVPVKLQTNSGKFAIYLPSADLEQSIAASITATKLFAAVTSDSKVKLTVELKQWEWDSFGINFNGKATTTWTVEADGKIQAKEFAGEAHKGFGDAMIAENRSRLVGAAALETSIKQGLEWVSTIPIGK